MTCLSPHIVHHFVPQILNSNVGKCMQTTKGCQNFPQYIEPSFYSSTADRTFRFQRVVNEELAKRIDNSATPFWEGVEELTTLVRKESFTR